MKVWISVISFFVLLLAFGPGCGGGGTNSSTGTGTTGIVSYDIEATKNGATIDPTNIVQGESIQFVVAGYTASGARSIQPSSGWSLDPTGQGEGSITGSGVFTATASGPGFTVSAMSGGSQQVGVAQVRPSGQALVTGLVTAGGGIFPKGAVLDFYNGSGTIVGTTVVQFDGTFRASVPTTAVTFELDKNQVPTGFYKEYRYGAKWYLPQGLCRAPLPPLTAGQTSPLSGSVLVLSTLGAPPPPPSQCGP